VDVWARDPKENEFRKTTHCIIIFVAVDDVGQPVSVPAWEPVTEEDMALKSYAERLMKLRKGIEEEMRQYLL
jgi:acyl-CoA hydrolase